MMTHMETNMVCVWRIISVTLSPVDVHAPDVTGWRLLSDTTIKTNPPERARKLSVVSIQVGEIPDISKPSDDKMDLITY